jgi:hypothetical protein
MPELRAECSCGCHRARVELRGLFGDIVPSGRLAKPWRVVAVINGERRRLRDFPSFDTARRFFERQGLRAP